MKEVKKTPQKIRRNYFYLTVFNLIKVGCNPSSISKKLNVSKQKLNYYLLTLKRNEFIIKKGYGTWEILKDFDEKEVKKTSQVAPNPTETFFTSFKEDMSRGHGFMYHLKIPKIYKWNQRQVFLDKKNIKYKPLNNLGGGQKLIIEGRKVHLKNNSILLYERSSYLTELAGESKTKAIYEFKKVIQKLERLLDVNLQIKKKYVFRVCREHYGIIKNIIAKQFDKEGKKLQCYSADGLWFLIDNSFNLHEAEIIKDRHKDENKAVERAEGFQTWMKSQKDTNFKVTPELILDFFNKNNQLVEHVTQNQQVFDANMKSHIKVIQEMAKSFNKFNRLLSSRQKKLNEFL